MSNLGHFQQEYDLLSEKIHHLRMAIAIETDAAVKFKLEKQIEEAEAERNRIEQQLSGAEKLAVKCPYRGLFAFREEDERFFFGRDAYTKKLVEAVRKQSLIAVIGASGSGKSSLVYAGLIPRLRHQSPSPNPSHQGREMQSPSPLVGEVGRRGTSSPPLVGEVGRRETSSPPLVGGVGGGGTQWLIASFRPGERPFHAVSTALVPFLEPELDEIDRISKIKKLAQKFTSGELNLTDIINAIVEKHPDSRVLLFADQFEELYTLCHDDNDRRQFLDELLSILPISPSPHLPISPSQLSSLSAPTSSAKPSPIVRLLMRCRGWILPSVQ